MEIPKYDFCEAKKAEDRSPLEMFIYYHEPAGQFASKEFRRQLRNALEWAAPQCINAQDTQSPVDLGVPCQKCGRTDGWICDCCL